MGECPHARIPRLGIDAPRIAVLGEVGSQPRRDVGGDRGRRENEGDEGIRVERDGPQQGIQRCVGARRDGRIRGGVQAAAEPIRDFGRDSPAAAGAARWTPGRRYREGAGIRRKTGLPGMRGRRLPEMTPCERAWATVPECTPTCKAGRSPPIAPRRDAWHPFEVVPADSSSGLSYLGCPEESTAKATSPPNMRSAILAVSALLLTPFLSAQEVTPVNVVDSVVSISYVGGSNYDNELILFRADMTYQDIAVTSHFSGSGITTSALHEWNLHLFRVGGRGMAGAPDRGHRHVDQRDNAAASLDALVCSAQFRATRRKCPRVPQQFWGLSPFSHHRCGERFQ